MAETAPVPRVAAIDTLGVVGAGTMGSGIAQLAATHGYDVVLVDLEESLVEEGIDRIAESLDRFVESGRIDEAERSLALDRVTGTTDPGALGDAGVVIEAVVEDVSVKRELFEELDRRLAPSVVLATNTSTISITEIAAATDRADRVVGLHFMNPPQLMPGVEIVEGDRTSTETVALAKDLAASLDRETWVAADRPGFVVNRILMPWINEAVRAADEGVADRREIDRAMELGTNVPMGPFELADQIGLDVCLAALEVMTEEIGERFRPAYALRRTVAAGDLGKKSGRGFYEYDDEGADTAEDSGGTDAAAGHDRR